jgi:hypothetical protein
MAPEMAGGNLCIKEGRENSHLQNLHFKILAKVPIFFIYQGHLQ